MVETQIRARGITHEGVLSVSHWPYARNPEQGFLASANQQPLDPRADARYFGSNWPSAWRAMRINALLRADRAVTPEAMIRYQTDPGSARADWYVPYFLAAGTRRGGRAGAAADLLAAWDRRYTRDNTRAVLFEWAMRELRRRTWDELGTAEGRLWDPTDMTLATLLPDSGNAWWDDRATDPIETRDDLLADALAAAFDSTVARYGEPEAGGWRWDRVNHANIWHLLRLPALSARGLAVQGGSGTLNPVSGDGTHGPSWRMVVELGPAPRAWATYPGGQSGNPFSRHYRDRVAGWADGVLEPVRLPRRPSDLPAEQVRATVRATGGRP